ncbi:hypothetical protein RLIN73S_04431 [Rhodanobacter lindaniclasticus]
MQADLFASDVISLDSVLGALQGARRPGERMHGARAGVGDQRAF